MLTFPSASVLHLPVGAAGASTQGRQGHGEAFQGSYLCVRAAMPHFKTLAPPSRIPDTNHVVYCLDSARGRRQIGLRGRRQIQLPSIQTVASRGRGLLSSLPGSCRDTRERRASPTFLPLDVVSEGKNQFSRVLVSLEGKTYSALPRHTRNTLQRNTSLCNAERREMATHTHASSLSLYPSRRAAFF